jgi:hypothetical protein
LVSQRTGIINQIRAFLLERGVAIRQGRTSVAEIRGTAALMRVRVAITAATAAPETLDKRRRIEGWDTGTNAGKLMHVSAALAQRASRKQRHEEHQQGKGTPCDKPK